MMGADVINMSFGGTSQSYLVETALASVIFVLTPQKLFFQIKMKLSFLSVTGDGKNIRI